MKTKEPKTYKDAYKFLEDYFKDVKENKDVYDKALEKVKENYKDIFNQKIK